MLYVTSPLGDVSRGGAQAVLSRPKGSEGAVLGTRESHNNHYHNGDLCGGFTLCQAHLLSYLIFTEFQHYPHFTDDETEAWRGQVI